MSYPHADKGAGIATVWLVVIPLAMLAVGFGAGEKLGSRRTAATTAAQLDRLASDTTHLWSELRDCETTASRDSAAFVVRLSAMKRTYWEGARLSDLP